MNDVTLAAGAMGVALVVMLVTLAYPAPFTIGTFLGVGLGSAALGLFFYGRAVLRDLRRRRAL